MNTKQARTRKEKAPLLYMRNEANIFIFLYFRCIVLLQLEACSFRLYP